MRKRLTAAVLAVTMLVSGSIVSPVTFETRGIGNVKKIMAKAEEDAFSEYDLPPIETTTIEKIYKGTCGKSATWNLDKNTGVLTISGSGKMYDYDSSTQPWQAVKSDIKTVKIGDKITYIGKSAFSYCHCLTTVILGKKVEKIGVSLVGAFESCPLESIYIGDSLKENLSELVTWSSNLQKVQLSSKNKYYYAKDNILMNKKKTKIYAVGVPKNRILTIPATITEIGEFAIREKNIDKINVKKGNKKYMVKNGKLYKKSTPSESICSPIPLGSLPSDSTVILTGSDFIFNKENFTLNKNEKVNTIILGKDVTLGQWQKMIHFTYLGNFWTYKNVEDPYGSMTMVLKEWFPNLSSIQVEEGNNSFKIQDDILYSKDGTTLLYCPNEKTGEVQIPEGVTTINDAAFNNCTKLKKISIADSVNTMYTNTIRYCEQLETIEIGVGLNTIKRIGRLFTYDEFKEDFEIGGNDEFLFMRCNALKKIIVASENKTFSSENGILYDAKKETLLRYPTQLAINYVMPDTVTYIYYGAFGYFGKKHIIDILLNTYEDHDDIWELEVLFERQCDDIGSQFEKCQVKSIRMSDNLDGVLNAYLLCECNQCENVFIGSSNTYYDIIDMAVYADIPNLEISEDNPYFSCKDGIVYDKKEHSIYCVLPSISGHITIPGNINSISQEVFSDCDGITSVTIEEGVKSIGRRAFENCKNLQSVSLPDTLTKIDCFAFYGCDALTSFTIPKNVTTLNYFFLNGKQLENISVSADNKEYMAENGILYDKGKETLIMVPSKIEKSFKISESVKNIDYYAFYGCTNVSEVIFNNKLEKIKNNAFSGCSNLTTIKFGENLKYIGRNINPIFVIREAVTEQAGLSH